MKRPTDIISRLVCLGDGALIVCLVQLALLQPACRSLRGPESRLFPAMSDAELRLALEEVLGRDEAQEIMDAARKKRAR